MEGNRAKPLTTTNVGTEKLAAKQEYDPTMTSCHLNLPKSLCDIQMYPNRGKDSEWPQIIENISPMTSGRMETVHETYHVTIERTANVANVSKLMVIKSTKYKNT